MRVRVLLVTMASSRAKVEKCKCLEMFGVFVYIVETASEMWRHGRERKKHEIWIHIMKLKSFRDWIIRLTDEES